MKPATVPICDACWIIEAAEPLRLHPVRLKEPLPEHCYRCDRATLSGIYVRRMIETEPKGT